MIDYRVTFEASSLDLDGEVGITGGIAVPDETILVNFPVGSRYYRTNGDVYVKTGAGNLATDWTISLGLPAPDGTQALPSIGFSSDPSSGIYLNAPGDMILTSNGFARLAVRPTNINMFAPIYGQAGANVSPSYTFTIDPDTGLFAAGPNQLGISTGGITRATFNAGGGLLMEGATGTSPGVGEINATAYRLNGVIQSGLPAVDGTAALPSISFVNDLSLGMSRLGPDELGLSAQSSTRLRINQSRIQTDVPLRARVGSANAPSYSFQVGADAGMYSLIGGLGLAFSTASVERLRITDGLLGVSVPIRAADGTVGTPSISFTSDSNTGLYRISNNIIGFSAAGNLRFRVSNGSIQTTVPMGAYDGTNLAPSYSFTSDVNTGIFNPGGDRLGFTTGGVARAEFNAGGGLLMTGATGTAPGAGEINATALYVNGVAVGGGGLPAADGTNILPSISFTSDLDTGMYRVAANTIGFSTGGATRLTLDPLVSTFSTPVASFGDVASDVAYGFVSDPDTGMYSQASNILNFSAGGVEVLRLGSTFIRAQRQFEAIDGTQAAPGYSFTSQTNSGMYRTAASQLSISVAGTEAVRYDATVFPVAIENRTRMFIPDGTVNRPTIALTSATGTGIYSPGLNRIGFTTNAIQRAEFNAGGGLLMAGATGTAPGAGEINATGLYINGTALGGLPAADGTPILPSISFTSDADTGMYRVAANTIGFSTGGTTRLTLDPLVSTFTTTLESAQGSPTLPAYSFTDDPDTGMYQSIVGQLNFSVGSSEALRLGSTFVRAQRQFEAIDGTVSAPGISFANEVNSGLYRPGNRQLAITTDSADMMVFDSVGVPFITVGGRFQQIDGAINRPAYGFSSQGNTGMYLVGLGRLGFTTGGVHRAEFNAGGGLLMEGATGTAPGAGEINATGLYINGTALGGLPAADGTAALPSISFAADIDTGMYRITDNVIGFAAAGNLSLRVSAGSVQTTVPLRILAGTQAAPAFSFEADISAGMYSLGTGTLGFSTGAAERMQLSSVSFNTNVPIRTITGTQAAPTYSFTSDTNTGMYTPAANVLGFVTAGVRRVEVTATGGLLMVGATGTAPGAGEINATALYVNGVAVGGGLPAPDGTELLPSIAFSSDTNTGMYNIAADTLGFSTGGTLRLRVGTDAVIPFLPIRGVDGTAALPSYTFDTDTDTGVFRPGANRLALSTAGLQRVEVTTTGDFLVGKTVLSNTSIGVGLNPAGQSNFVASGVAPLAVNRQGADGAVLNILNDNVVAGSIDVAGTTVIYNSFCGAHWSQLFDNSNPVIPIGTVVSAISEMLVNKLDSWDEDGNTISTTYSGNLDIDDTYVEDGVTHTIILKPNDQLVKFKVSTTPSDTAVYGVFDKWRETGDASIQSLGATRVRVIGAITVGDLLVSNGDGTAIKQTDDIIRSSTLGKATFTNALTTEKLVPCVLYCG